METDSLKSATEVAANLSEAIEVTKQGRKQEEPLYITYLKLKERGYWKGEYNFGTLTVLVELIQINRNKKLGN